MRLKTMITILLMILLNSCATKKIKFYPDFEIWNKGKEKRACLTMEKVIELKNLLIDEEYEN